MDSSLILATFSSVHVIGFIFCRLHTCGLQEELKDYIHIIHDHEIPPNLLNGLKSLEVSGDDGRRKTRVVDFENVLELHRVFPLVFYPMFRFQTELQTKSVSVNWWRNKRHQLLLYRDKESLLQPVSGFRKYIPLERLKLKRGARKAGEEGKDSQENIEGGSASVGAGVGVGATTVEETSKENAAMTTAGGGGGGGGGGGESLPSGSPPKKPNGTTYPDPETDAEEIAVKARMGVIMYYAFPWRRDAARSQLKKIAAIEAELDENQADQAMEINEENLNKLAKVFMGR